MWHRWQFDSLRLFGRVHEDCLTVQRGESVYKRAWSHVVLRRSNIEFSPSYWLYRYLSAHKIAQIAVLLTGSISDRACRGSQFGSARFSSLVRYTFSRQATPSNLTTSMGCRGGNQTCRVLRGSKASRRPSPIKLIHNTVNVISSPGKNHNHGAL